MDIQIHRFETGPLQTNTYIVENKQGTCVIFDPSSECELVLEHLKTASLKPQAIILTHGHFDHILGIPEILHHYPSLAIYIHEKDSMMLRDPVRNGSMLLGVSFAYKGAVVELEEGKVDIGDFTFDVFHVPGHTPGGCAIMIKGNCISGDILFAGSIGRTDLPGGNTEALLSGIKEKLLVLPDTTILYPGHGGRTTIGREKRLNPFFT